MNSSFNGEMPSRPKRMRVAEIRKDLEVSIVPRGGDRVAVVKDSLAHRFYELDPTDLEIAALLDATLDKQDLVNLLRRRLPEACGKWSDETLLSRISRISQELRATGLAKGSSHASPAPTVNKSPFETLIYLGRKISRLLFWRFRLFDPTALLDATVDLSRPFFRSWFLWFILIVFSVAFSFFVGRGGMQMFDASWFGSATSLAALYIGIAGLKFLHEAGHALAVRRFGGSVHEVGITLVAGLPLFHVEASDSYLFPKKSQRLAVASSGILIEILAAAGLIGIWLVLADGFTRQLFTHLIILASVSTIFFNGNPLMRYDGYYILADALDMPDLRQRARAHITALLSNFLTGLDSNNKATRRDAWILGSYGIASSIYLLIVFLGVWKFVSTALAPYGMKWLGDSLIMAWGITGIAMPALSTTTAVFKNYQRAAPVARKRAIRIFSAIATLLVLALFIPLPRWTDDECVLQPTQSCNVRIVEEGYLKVILVNEGDRVTAGQTLAILENNAISANFAKAATELEKKKTMLRDAMASGNPSAVGILRSEVAATTSQFTEASRRLESLVLKANADGTIASRQLDSLLGKKIGSGEVFCVIQPDRLDESLVTLNEKQARLVNSGAAFKLRLNAYPEMTLKGIVTAPPLRLSPRLPAALALPSGADTHFALLQITNAPSEKLKIGMTGRVRIDCGKQSPASRLLEELLDFFHLDVRMQ
jgi:putative peptide zinc metalloprotease protein